MFTEILIPQYVTDVLTNFDNDCMLYLKGEENFGTGEVTTNPQNLTFLPSFTLFYRNLHL